MGSTAASCAATAALLLTGRLESGMWLHPYTSHSFTVSKPCTTRTQQHKPAGLRTGSGVCPGRQ